MTSVKKIGAYAFSGCTSLANMSFNQTTGQPNQYTFYSCNFDDSQPVGQKTTVKSSPDVSNLSTGVLDLSNCSSLTHIGYNAFYTSGSKIQYAILPRTSESWTRNTDGIVTTESNLYFGKDEAGTTGAVFGKFKKPNNSGTTNTIVFVRETVYQAYYDLLNSYGTNIGNHYVKSCFSNCTTYYYAEYKSDIEPNRLGTIRYWTYDEDIDKWIMFANGNQAKDYLPDYPGA